MKEQQQELVQVQANVQTPCGNLKTEDNQTQFYNLSKKFTSFVIFNRIKLELTQAASYKLRRKYISCAHQ